MVDVKQAVRSAKDYATEMLGWPDATVEEIERDTYKGREAWSITLSSPRRGGAGSFNELMTPGTSLDYKRFMIDVEDGSFLGITIRELTNRR